MQATLPRGQSQPTVQYRGANAGDPSFGHGGECLISEASPAELFVGAIGASYAEALAGVLGIAQLPWSALEVETDAESIAGRTAPCLESIIVHPTIFGGDPFIRDRYRAAVRQARDHNLAGDAIRGNVAYKVGGVMVVVPNNPDPVMSHEGVEPRLRVALADESDSIMGRHLSALNLRWPDETLTTLDIDCTLEDVALGCIFKGRASVADYYSSWRGAFGLTLTTARRYHIGTDTMIVEERYLGTHQGLFRGIAPTHRRIDLRIAAVLSVRDGLVADARLYYDAASLLRQLGVSPSCECAHQTDATPEITIQGDMP